MSYLPIEAGLQTVLEGSYPGKVFKRFAPDNIPLPYIVYQRISSTRGQTMKGNDGIVNARIQVSVWAADDVTAKRYANSIRLALLNILNTTWGSHLVAGISLENELDDFDADVIVNGAHGAYGVRLDFMVTYFEEAAGEAFA